MLLGKAVMPCTFRSTPRNSRYSRAPYSFRSFPNRCEILQYAGRFFLGTGSTNNSTYPFMVLILLFSRIQSCIDHRVLHLAFARRSEEHTSELQSQFHPVSRLLLLK